MIGSHYVAWFFAGLFLANAVPHLVNGSMGRPFQSPFAKPPGRGLSSSSVNVLWGSFNLVVGYLLLFHVGRFDLRRLDHAGITGFAWIAGSCWLARNFGAIHGGNAPIETERGRQN